jgi:HK97 family phage major capsid protein
MKKSDQIKARIADLKNEATKLIDKDDVTKEELAEIRNKIKLEEEKLEIQNSIEIEEVQARVNSNPLKGNETNPFEAPKNKKELGQLFAKVVVGQATAEELMEVKNVLKESVGEKGELLVPVDVQTAIIELQRNKFDIRNYVNVEPVTVLKGTRTKEVGEPQASGFPSLDEGAAIQALYEPTFGPAEYSVRKYGGYIPLTSELLNDTPENILGYINKWLAKNELNTYAYQTFNGTGTASAEGIMQNLETDEKLVTRVTKQAAAPTIKDFKTIFNVDLEDIPDDGMKIFTNAAGYNHLDSLEDGNGRSYIQPDATLKSGYRFLGREIVKVPTKFLATYNDGVDDYTPFIIGDLEQLYTIYQRKGLGVSSTNVGGDSWRNDTTEIKGLFRFDGKINGDIKAVKILLSQMS